MEQKSNESSTGRLIEISNEHFARVQNLVHLGSWKLDLETRTVEGTKEARKIYGVSSEQLSLSFLQSIALSGNREILDLEMNNLIAGNSEYNIEYQIKRVSDGEIRTIHSMAEYDPVGNSVTGTFQDITERKKIEYALADSERRYRTLFDNSVSGILYMGLDGSIIEINRKMLEFLGSPSQEETKRINMLTFPLLVQVGFSADLAAVLKDRKSVSNSANYESKWGKTLYLEYDLTPIESGNSFIGVMGKIEDITERKHAEARIEALLKEKDIILREVHHRIKNNMSSIESLFRLQVDNSDNFEVKTELKDAISRLSSMRVLYEKLYQSDDFMETSSKAYLTRLIDDIAEVFPESENITIEKQFEDFMIPSKITFSLGIIINELLTNSLKYAFTKDDENKLIFVSAKKTGTTVSIIVRDNGVGYAGFDNPAESSGFGLQLVRMLSEQIGGSTDFYNDDGAVFTIDFRI